MPLAACLKKKEIFFFLLLFYFLNIDDLGLSALGQLGFYLLVYNQIILSNVISIVFIFYGDYLINIFNIEKKIP